jgi:uncharacterized protein YggE
MNLAIMVALAVIAVFLVVFALAVSVWLPHPPTITVMAVGTASAKPAQAVLSVQLNATGKTAGAANANLSVLANMLNSTLMPLVNGNSSDIQTLSYNIYQPTVCTYPKMNMSVGIYCVPQKLPYFASTEYISVTIPSIGNVSAAITQLSAIPGLQLQNVQAQLSGGQQAALSQLALSRALANATSQASILAGSGTSVEIKNITVQGSQIFYPFYASGASMGVAAVRNSTLFFGGQATVQKGVYVNFVIR